MKNLIRLAVLTILAPSLAHAHTVGAEGSGFLAGLSHPVLGLDHLLAMVSVGILSAQMGGRAIWTVPATFVAVMIVGGLLGMNGIPLFSVETGIAISVLALGIALATGGKLPVLLAMGFVGFFAVFHGHAHGTEMPAIARPALFALGFAAGTAGLHIFGVLIGLVSQRIPNGTVVLRYAGAAIAGLGFHLVFL